MIVYFAGAAGYLDRSRDIDAVLVSYAYPDDILKLDGKLGRQVRALFVDSGAFTAATKGASIDIAAYAAWVREVGQECRRQRCAFTYANLDVMGDQRETWANQRWLERHGMEPVPIITFGAEASDIRRTVENYPYLALGGLVPHARGRVKLTTWFDRVYRSVYDYWARSATMTRVHWFGFISEWAGLRWPVYSADSRAWMFVERRGAFHHRAFALRPGKYLAEAHRGRGNELARVAAHEDIARMRDIGRTVTSVWQNRGIRWRE